MSIWRIRFACWIIKATGIHLEYVTLIVFPRQKWLREHSSMLRDIKISLLFIDVSGLIFYELYEKKIKCNCDNMYLI